jgi:hypothetical protein
LYSFNDSSNPKYLMFFSHGAKLSKMCVKKKPSA